MKALKVASRGTRLVPGDLSTCGVFNLSLSQNCPTGRLPSNSSGSSALNGIFPNIRKDD